MTCNYILAYNTLVQQLNDCAVLYKCVFAAMPCTSKQIFRFSTSFNSVFVQCFFFLCFRFLLLHLIPFSILISMLSPIYIEYIDAGLVLISLLCVLQRLFLFHTFTECARQDNFGITFNLLVPFFVRVHRSSMASCIDSNTLLQIYYIHMQCECDACIQSM